MNTQMELAFRAALERQMTEFTRRERNSPNFVRIQLDRWDTRRGGWVLTPGGANPHLNGSRIIQLVDRVRVTINDREYSFRANWNSDLPRLATMSARFNGGGNPVELIEDPDLGLVASNDWPEELQGQVKFISAQQEKGSDYRLVRFEATENVAELIQACDGLVYIGFDRGTIQNNKKDCRRGVPIVYRLQGLQK